jgi:hypothetical protein
VKIESVKEHYPSHKIEIKLQTENLRAHFDNFIWISDENVEAFVTQLDNLDKTRKGKATLTSMSPGEFELTFKPIDDLGHIAVGLLFNKQDRINHDYSFEIKVEFQTDPTILPTVLKDIKRLAD